MDLMARRLALHTARALLDNLPRAEISSVLLKRFGSFDRAEHAARDLYETEA
jgi:hypothetical protein